MIRDFNLYFITSYSVCGSPIVVSACTLMVSALSITVSHVKFYLMFCKCICMQAPKPSSGPHKSRECLPLILILRNRLKYALTYREVIAILMQRHILVDGKVRTDKTYPTGFMGMHFSLTSMCLGC